MRIATIGLLLFIGSSVQAQDSKMHYGFGFSGGTLNAPSSIASGFSFSMDRDLVKSLNSSLTIGTNLKIGTQDPTGLVFPASLILVGIALYANDPSAFQNINFDPQRVRLFTEIPLLLHYHYGLGSNRDSEKRFGFYFGGGLSYTVTGFADDSGKDQGASFFGWMMDGGFRFRSDLDIGFGRLSSFQSPISQIQHPAFYEIRFSWSF